MAIVLDVIKRSLRLCGETGEGETPNSDQVEVGLASLNSMIDGFNNERLYIYQILEETFTLVSGFGSYTIGVSGNLNTTRPVRIEDSCFILYQNVVYPVHLVSESGFTYLQTVNQSQMPTRMYYDESYPLGTIYFDYICDKNYEFHLKKWSPIFTFTDSNSTFDLPPGYRRMVEFNLAVEMCSEFGLQPLPWVVKVSDDTRRSIKSINRPDVMMATEIGYLSSNGRAGMTTNILTG